MSRSTIREISTKYRLEPSLRDVFVEGKSDKVLFKWFLTRAGCTESKVLTVESVDIPTAFLLPLDLSDGNKQRVIALATELNRCLGDEAPQFTCVVDADEDRLLNTARVIPQLLWTDFAAVEAYAFDEIHLTKFIEIVLGCEGADVPSLIAEYSITLTELFLIRAAIKYCALPVRWLDFTGCCSRSGTHIHLDADEFLVRLLNASGQRQSHTQVLAAIEDLRKRTDPDGRHQLNGHDFVELLCWDRREFTRKKELRSATAVSAAMAGVYEYGLLRDLPLFRKLVARCTKGAL